MYLILINHEYKGETYTSNNDWTGSVGDPNTMTHSKSGWGWKIGGKCQSLVLTSWNNK